jgi:hypothetical protein
MVNADAFYGEFLKAEDVKQEIDVTVKAASVETIDGERKLTLQTNELHKKFVLNKTNKDRLKAQFGTAETDNWLGKKFTLGTEQVQFKGDTVPAIRVKTVDRIDSEVEKEMQKIEKEAAA